MASVEAGIQAQIRNIEAIYGKTMQAWFGCGPNGGRASGIGELVAIQRSRVG